MSEEKKNKLQESGLIEWPVFSELIAMDEDEEGFSKSLFQTFVDQFVETCRDLEVNLKEQNLDKLSGLGHYLKGSAAALGLERISNECERIQNYGKKINFDDFKLKDSSLGEDDDEFWIKLIGDALQKARDNFDQAKKALNDYFDDEL
ncbi:Phosphorelay intermediate protein YPD1 [Meyerozyma sp. JA9]|jgi:osomolarity two-component system phosphorelay intermediate protein YPD1|nr:Phosphorelay intermediate protein YPD1 [Meyerozyma sp. JA9]